jgi:hypothetical protein
MQCCEYSPSFYNTGKSTSPSGPYFQTRTDFYAQGPEVSSPSPKIGWPDLLQGATEGILTTYVGHKRHINA